MAARVQCLACALLAVGTVGAQLRTNASMVAGLRRGSSITLVSGATAVREMCLIADDGSVSAPSGSVVLADCAAAVAAGGGLELWQHKPNGQLLSLSSDKCLTAVEDSVVLMDCGAALKTNDGRSEWEMLGSGQLKVAAGGGRCLSQKGPAPGEVNEAAKAAVSATSTASVAHGGSMAVDGREGTYWASKFDPADAVDMLIDLGETRSARELVISWVYPAKAFAVQLSQDGEHFAEVFATDVNVLKSTRVPLHGPARLVRISMRETHPVHGTFESHALYGIKSIVMHGSPLAAVVEDCGVAANSKDARDKYFAVAANEHDLSAGTALRSELPALEAAKSALSVAVSDLASVLPQVPACLEAGGLLGAAGVAPTPTRVAGPGLAAGNALAAGAANRRAGRTVGAAQTTVAANAPGHFDAQEADALFQEARANIIGVRKVLG